MRKRYSFVLRESNQFYGATVVRLREVHLVRWCCTKQQLSIGKAPPSLYTQVSDVAIVRLVCSEDQTALLGYPIGSETEVFDEVMLRKSYPWVLETGVSTLCNTILTEVT